MKYLLEIIKAFLSAWFTARREETAHEKLQAQLQKLETQYEHAKQKRREMLLAGYLDEYSNWTIECIRLSVAIADIRTRLGQNPVE